MPRFLVPVGLTLLGVAVIIGLITIVPRTSPPGTHAVVAVAARGGFGKLPALAAEEAAVPAQATGTKAGSATLAAPAPQADSAVSGVAAGSGGSVGVGIAEPGMPTRIRPIPPPEQYLPPRVVYTWEGSTLPTIPAELAVFRAVPAGFAAQVASFGSAVGLTLPGGRLTSFSFRGDDGMTFSFDAGSGMVSWYRDNAVQPANANNAATMSDADAIAAADAFLAKLGVNRAAYGAPQVVRYDNPCGNDRPCIMQGSAGGSGIVPMMSATKSAASAADGTVSSGDARPTIWPGPGWQPSVTVRYGAKLDALPTLEWDGSDSGAITIQVSAGTRAVESGSLLLLNNLQRSLYATQPIGKILDAALHGGTNPWGGEDGGVYTPAEEAKRPVVHVRLTEARVGYLQKWSDLGDGPTSYFLPVVAFRGTVTDQYKNASPYAAIVSALDPTVFASEEPTPVPVPYGKPLPSGVEGSVPPAVETQPAPEPR